MRMVVLTPLVALMVGGLVGLLGGGAGLGSVSAWADDQPAAEGPAPGGQAVPPSAEGVPSEDPSAPDDSLDQAGAAFCGAAARQCGRACQATTEPGSAASAACEARCAVERAACQTRDALSGVEPWLNDKAEKMDRFMDGFEADPEAVPEVQSPAGKPTREACQASHDQCVTRCGDRFDDDYGRAGCESVCAMNRATCETSAGIESARPLIEREVQRLQDFLGALGGKGAEPPPPPPLDPLDPDEDGGVDL